MAVNALSTQQCTVAGITPTRTAMAVAPDDTYTFPNDGRIVLSFLKDWRRRCDRDDLSRQARLEGWPLLM